VRSAWAGGFVIRLILLGPALLGLAVVVVYPLVATVRGSMYSEVFTALGPKTAFVGLDNFGKLFTSAAFWESVRITFMFNIVTTPLQVAASLGLAVLVNSRLRGRAVYRSLFSLPLMVSLPVACILWQVLFSPAGGLVNSMMSGVGLPQQGFLDSTSQALWVISFIASWKGVPYWMLFFLAGLQTLNPSLLEAARLDGATGFRLFWHVTLPGLKRTLLFVAVADTVANFFLFAPQYLLTQGGPSGSTETLMFRLYDTAFTGHNFGMAYAMATSLFVMTGVCVIFIFVALRGED
jgi:multiple sugar transport system permease protein